MAEVSARHRQHGFTLLEAIVALVLISSAGMALFSWINSDLDILNRIDAGNARNGATRNIIEYMSTVNPMLQSEGHAELGDYSLDWNAKATTTIMDGANYPQGISLYQLALYDTHIDVQRGGKAWFDFKLRQVGYKKVRELRLPFS